MPKYNQEMHVRETNLTVKIGEGSRKELSKLVVTEDLGNLVHEITPDDKSKSFVDIDPIEYNLGRITVGYGAQYAGIVRVYVSEGRIHQMVYYNLIIGESIPEFSL